MGTCKTEKKAIYPIQVFTPAKVEIVGAKLWSSVMHDGGGGVEGGGEQGEGVSDGGGGVEGGGEQGEGVSDGGGGVEGGGEQGEGVSDGGLRVIWGLRNQLYNDFQKILQ